MLMEFIGHSLQRKSSFWVSISLLLFKTLYEIDFWNSCSRLYEKKLVSATRNEFSLADSYNWPVAQKTYYKRFLIL